MRPESPSLVESAVVDLDLGPVGIADEGEGPVFVAVHGLPGSAYDYRWLASALSGHARIVRIDMPGFGKTPAGRFGLDIDARGDFVCTVIEQLGLHDAVVLGHSVGGALAVRAGLQSDRVRAVGLLASIGLTLHRGLRRAPGLRVVGYALHLPPVRALLLPRIHQQMLSQGFKGVSPEATLQTCFAVARLRLSTHARNLAALRKPTLVAWAADDPLVEEAISEKLYWAAPVGPRIRFTDGGHNIQATRSSELAEALIAWEKTLT